MLGDQHMQKPRRHDKEQGVKPHRLELGKQELYRQTSPFCYTIL